MSKIINAVKNVRIIQLQISFFQNMNLSPKLILSYLILILAPLAIFGGILYRISIKEIEIETKRVSLQSTIQVNKVFDEFVNQIDKATMTFYIDRAVADYLRAKARPDAYYAKNVEKKREDACSYIESLLEINSDVWSISIVSMRNDIIAISRNGYERPMYDFLKDGYYKDLIASTGGKVLLSVHNTSYMFSPGKRVFTVGRKYLDVGVGTRSGLGTYTGYIMVECSDGILDHICENVEIGKNGFILFADNHGNLVYSSRKAEGLLQKYNQITQKYMQNKLNNIVTVNGDKLVLVSNTSKLTGWTAIGIIPYSEIVNRVKGIRYAFILLSIVCIIAVLFASIAISKSITRPIKELHQAMRSFEHGNTSVQVNTISKNEVGELARGFNGLIEKVNHLIMSIRSIEIKKREAELDALRSQINPHFLYNTLDSIRMMALIDESKGTATAVEALSDLFRYNIKQKKDLVEIKDEIKQIKNYTHLQKIRYEEWFDVRYEIDEALMDYKTLKFTLQPIVENAIIHGLEKKRGKGMLTVCVKKVDESILFIIRDEGVGMDEETLEKLKDKIRGYGGDENVSIGLKNINERVVLYFGDSYGLTFDSRLGEGTCVTLTIPAFKDERGIIGDVIGISGR